MCRFTRPLFFLVAFQVAGSIVWAQNDIQPIFEFSLSNPGARSMGLGGAFVALADDATAAFANPAGLFQIAEPEVSIEGRSWKYSTPFVAGGRIFGEPWGIGLDNSSGLRYGEASTDLSGLSFLSIVYPQKRWSVALSRHQLANFKTTSALHGLYSGPWPEVATIRREWDQRRSSHLEIVSTSLAVAFRVGDHLSIGLGFTHFTGELSSISEVYGLTELTAETFFAPSQFVHDNLGYSRALSIDDTDRGLVTGFLWRFNNRWRIAGVLREGPELECSTRLTAGPLNRFGVADGWSQILLDEPMEFPDVLGFGVAYRILEERLTLSFEWDRVGYSSLLKYLNATGAENELEDGDELHVGGEYVLARTKPTIAVRAGAWVDPAHRVHNSEGYVTRAILPPGSDQLHLSVGVGAAFKEFQFDIGLDLSDEVDTASFSTIYTF
jgi:long-subunit fatty acid transport protein